MTIEGRERDMGDIAQMKAKLDGLVNVRRCQTGQRAAATQRKIDALYQEILDAEQAAQQTVTSVKITPAQAAVLDAHEGGSEYLSEAQDQGVTWTRSTLTVPAAGAPALGNFVAMRAEIASDNLADAQDGQAEISPADRGEYRATLNLAAKVRAALTVTESEEEPVTENRLQIGDRVQGTMQGQEFTGTISSLGLVRDVVTTVHVTTDHPMITPAGREVDGVRFDGADAIARLTPAPALPEPMADPEPEVQPEPEPVEPSEPREWKLTPEEINLTIGKLCKINARAVAQGLEGRWSWTIGEPEERREPQYDMTGASSVINGVPHRMEQGRPVPCEFLGYRTLILRPLTVTGQPPVIKGWKFIATATWDGGTFVTRCTPGFAGRIGDMTQACDHCHTNRQRNDTYLLENQAGERVQVGSTCIKDFLGHDFRPSWIPQESELDEDIESLMSDRGSRYQLDAETSHILAWAASMTERHGWVSRDKAEIERRTPSSYLLKDLLFGNRPADREARKRLEPTEAHKALAATVLEWARNLTPGDSEYLANVQRLAQASYVTERNVGILGSAVASYSRELQRKAEDEARKGSAWFGEIKERVTVAATLRSDTPIEGDWGTRHRYAFTTREGNSVVWWASSGQGLEIGTAYAITGTVKGHETWKEVRSTVLTRCKVTEPEHQADTERQAC